MEPGKKYDKLPYDQDPFDMQRYQAAIGSLTYASIATRPDTPSEIGVLSQFMFRPGPEHWAGIKRVFQNIRSTLDFGIKFVASDKGNFNLQGFADADWAGDAGFLLKKNLRGGGQKTIGHCFSKQYCLYCSFHCFLKILGGKTPFREDKSRFGGRPLPPVPCSRKPGCFHKEIEGSTHCHFIFHRS